MRSKINRAMDKLAKLPGYIVSFTLFLTQPILLAIALTIGYSFIEAFLVEFFSTLFEKEVDEDGQAR